MSERSEFFSKVYDKYLKSDYASNDTDLNPKREIEPAYERIVKKVRDNLENIRLGLASYDANRKAIVTEKKQYTTEDGLDYDTLKHLSESSGRRYCGGDTLNIGLGEVDALIEDIKSSISDTSIKILESGSDISDSLDATLSDLSILLQMNCKTFDNYNSLLSSLESSVNDLEGLLDSDSIINNEGGIGEFDNVLDAYFNWARMDPEKIDDLKKSVDSKKIEKSKGAQAGKGNNPDEGFLKCAEASLALLMVVLIILKIIMILKTVLTIIINTLVTATAICSKITQCWVNPPSIADAIAYLSDIALGLVKQILAAIVDHLWNMLELACGSTAFKSTLDNVKDTITATRMTYNSGKELIMNAMSIEGLAENLASKLDFTEQWNKAKENYSNEIKRICSTWENVGEDWYGYIPAPPGETQEEKKIRCKKILEKAMAKWLEYGNEVFNMSNAGKAIYDLTDPNNKMCTEAAQAALSSIAEAQTEINKATQDIFKEATDTVTYYTDVHAIEKASEFFDDVKLNF